jgi:hypothetical protein
LSGIQVSVTVPITVTALGLFADTVSGFGRLALYASDPSTKNAATLQVATSSFMMGAGKNEIGVSPTPIAAGTYWLLGEFSAQVEISADTTVSLPYEYYPTSFGNIPTTYPGSLSHGSRLAYYLVGDE